MKNLKVLPLLLLFYIFCIVQAQNVLIEYQGEERFQSEYFTTDKPWQVQISGDAIAYIYDVALGNHVQTITESTAIEVKGMIFLFVVPNSGSYSTSVYLQQTELNPPDLDYYNCDDFETPFLAQQFFEGNDYNENNDPHKLDLDSDGHACEFDPFENYDQAYIPIPNCVNINMADLATLTLLKGIGDTIAQRIIDARPFNSIDELDRVKGIGSKKVSVIKLQRFACIE